jgi:DNA-binding NarL/FixJ family response regulator
VPRLLVVDERVRERATLVDELRQFGFDVTTTLDATAESLTAIVVAIDGARGNAALPPCARSEPAKGVPIIVVVADNCGPDVRLRAAIEGAALCLEGPAAVDAIALAVGAVAGPAARPLPDQRRLARMAALEALARAEGRAQGASSSSDRCDVRLTRLEHAPAREVAEPEPSSALARCTPKQRALLEVIARSGSVTNAATVLGTTRRNLYATLRRIAHRAGLRDSTELLRAIGLRGTSDPPRP